MSYSTGTIQIALGYKLQHYTLYCHLQEDTHNNYCSQMLCLVTYNNITRMEERSSRVIFGFVREQQEPLVSWAVCCTFLLQSCMGEELMEVLGFQIWLLPLALFKSSIGAARLLGLFAANSSVGVFLSLCESSTSHSFLGKCCLLQNWGRSWMFPFCGWSQVQDYNFVQTEVEEQG